MLSKNERLDEIVRDMTNLEERLKCERKHADRLLAERDDSRANGDVLARAVASFLAGKTSKEDLKRALGKHRADENFFVTGHAKAAMELAST